MTGKVEQQEPGVILDPDLPADFDPDALGDDHDDAEDGGSDG